MLVLIGSPLEGRGSRIRNINCAETCLFLFCIFSLITEKIIYFCISKTLLDFILFFSLEGSPSSTSSMECIFTGISGTLA